MPSVYLKRMGMGMRLEITMTPAEKKKLKASSTAIWRMSDDGPNGSIRDREITKLMAKLLHRSLKNEEAALSATA